MFGLLQLKTTAEASAAKIPGSDIRPLSLEDLRVSGEDLQKRRADIDKAIRDLNRARRSDQTLRASTGPSIARLTAERRKIDMVEAERAASDDDPAKTMARYMF